ncbi:Inner membrane protein translocase and chaperone YidC, long form [hydrothermal vent metagenome]|uniref:Membrane protein insertase YidC n=1 Tax=hydrothermal vent metagenome TaxID=652676 RepID=A0A3B1BHE2_9ZZZZ
MIDRNFFMALIAAFAMVIAYNYYYEMRFGDYLRTEQANQMAEVQKEQDKAIEKPPVTAVETKDVTTQHEAGLAPASTPLAVSPPLEAVETHPADGEKRITIDTGVTKVVLTNKGAVPLNYLLEGYQNGDAGEIDLIFNLPQYIQARKAQDEKVAALEKIKPYPTLGFRFSNDKFSNKVNGSLFSASTKDETVVMHEGDEPFTIVYELEDTSGIVIRKKFTFHYGDYSFDFSALVKSTEKWGAFDYSLVWFGLGEELDAKKMAYNSYHGPVMMVNGERLSGAPEDDEPEINYKGVIKWGAVANRYYTAAAIPQNPSGMEVVSRYIDDTHSALEWKFKAKLSNEPESFVLFVGPKKHSALENYTNGMYSIIDYGWLDFFAKPLFWVLNFFHGLFGNWGWAIIALTACIKVLFFPLSQKSFKSMKRMQVIQPQMKKLQETYKNDKEQLNREMLKMYREHKVNPLGGCLPMVLQIPVFFALYKVLLESIELKGAGFILWITDLAVKDPYYVTPVLMGASMLAQMMMTPSTGDKAQRYVMLAMPIVFTFMFLSFPAGLVIYWLVNNLLTIGQQWIIYREK